MQVKSRNELSMLAKIMVENYKINNIIDTNEFYEFAIHEMDENDIRINYQTLKNNWDWFKNKCIALNKDNEEWDIIEENDIPKLRQISKIVVYYNDGTQEEVSVKEMISLPNEVVKVETPLPFKEYTLFCESEDGLLIIRGKYKGLYVQDVDIENFPTCLAGWSKYQLELNEKLGVERKGALTKDDIKVLTQFVHNTYDF